MKPTLKGRAKSVIKAWDEFLKSPAYSMPKLAEAIESMRNYIEQVEKDEQDKEPKLF